jgi:LmbE family N-acetylglucosaminyl deacetylase
LPIVRKLIRYISKLGHRLLALGGIRVPLRLYMKLVHKNYNPAVVTVPAAEHVLVLAPHMDDETIGCGGAILSHVAKGSTVEVVFITDGTNGFEKSFFQAHTTEKRREIRKKECVKACTILGVSRFHFLDLPDGRSQPTDAAVRALADIMDTVQPDLTYLPFITDAHHDHRTTSRIFLAAVEQRKRFSFLLCCCYEVWSPIYPNCIIDISEHMNTKMSALSCYKSQLRMNNYLSSIKGLNAYRAINNQSKGYAEAFYLTTVSEYLSLQGDL